MKKLLIVSGIAISFFAVSCKKDYTCTCTYDFGGSDTTVTFDYDKQKKKDAEDACSTQETQLQSVDPNASCSL